MILFAISILIIIVLALVYSRALRDESGPMKVLATVIAAAVSLVVIFAGVLVPLILLLAARYWFPAAIPAAGWLDVLYVALLTGAGMFLYELKPEKFLVAYFKWQKWHTSALLVVKAIVTFVLLILVAGWLGHSWNPSALLIIAVLMTLVDYVIDKATNSADL